MKYLIALLVIVPALISALLFTVAFLLLKDPTVLGGSLVIAVLCLISGVIAALPLVSAIGIGLWRLFGFGKNKSFDKKDKES